MPSSFRKRQKEALCNTLYDTALELFRDRGFEATTVQEITASAGVAKGTFYNHFPTKEHVLARWYDGITARALSAARLRDAASTRKAVGDLFADLSGQATAEPELLLAKFRNGVSELLVDAERHQARAILSHLHELCADAVSRGELPADLEIAPFCDLLVAVLTGTSRAWVYARPDFDFPATIRERVDFLFDALRPAQEA